MDMLLILNSFLADNAGAFLWIAVGLFGLGAVFAVGASIFRMIDDFATMRSAVIGIVVLGVIFGLAWGVTEHDPSTMQSTVERFAVTDFWFSMSGVGLSATLILIVLALLLIVAEVRTLFN